MRDVSERAHFSLAEAAALVDQAEVDPVGTITRAQELSRIEGVAEEPAVLARVLRAWAIALRVSDRVDASLDVFDLAMAAATSSTDLDLLAETRTSRAAALLQHGDTSGALAELDAVLATAPSPRAYGFASFQRASVLLRVGRFDEASADLNAAVPLLDAAQAVRYAAHAVSNRGLICAFRGDYRSAESDFRDALRRYEAASLAIPAADTVQNLGYVAHRRGDTLEALRLYAEAEARHRALGLSGLAAELDRARALLDVGLATEALARARAVAERLAATGSAVDAGEALLVAAGAAVAAQHYAEGADIGREASDVFLSHGRHQLALAAQLIALRCLVLEGPVDDELLGRVDRLAGSLAVDADPHQRAEALVLRGETLIRRDRATESLTVLRQVPASWCTIELRARLHTARAQARMQIGDRKGAQRQVTAGLQRLDDLRASFGALDLRTGIGVHAEGLQQVSASLGLTSGRPWQIVVRSEATRAAALRFPSGQPVKDERLAAVLDELRSLDERRSHDPPETAGARAGRRSELQRRVADLNRIGGIGDGRRLSCPSLNDVREVLGGGCLAVLTRVNDDLVGVAIGRKVTRHALGSYRELLEASRSVELALRRLARATTGDRSRQLAAEHVADVANAWGARLNGLLAGPGPLAIVPPASLLSFPWAVLPQLRDRPHVVSPSVTVWNAMSRSTPASDRVVLVAGGQLAHAESEVRAAAQAWPAARTLMGAEASAAGVIRAVDGARLVHVAAHHRTNPDNPLFSALQLADGWLYGHDLLRLDRAPHVVVLSVCDAAQVDSVLGDEALGTTLAFLAAGARSVIASPSLVPDTPETQLLMTELHRELAGGARPAEALLAARRALLERNPANPVVWGSFACFGS